MTMIRSETLIIIALIILVWRLATRAASSPTPPDDTEPHTETPANELRLVPNGIQEDIERAQAS
jgi:hypothetical protein